jgi:hypothetical protein
MGSPTVTISGFHPGYLYGSPTKREGGIVCKEIVNSKSNHDYWSTAKSLVRQCIDLQGSIAEYMSMQGK